MADKTPQSINLLEPVLEPDDSWTKIYNWISSTGRLLLIMVAMLVVGVFFSRFILDKENNDLTDEINSNISDVLENQVIRQEEIKYRNIHTFLTDIVTIRDNQKINSTKIASILDTIPSNFSLKSFSFSNSTAMLILEAGTLEEVGIYTSDLNSNPRFSEVTSTVTKEASSGIIEFSVSFNVE